jgi:hypothetical protein
VKKFLLLFALVLVSCDVQHFLKPERPVPSTVDVICDFGGGSSGCTASSLEVILREVTPSLPAGSVVRLHGMTDDVARASQLAVFTTTKPKKRTVRAVAGHQRRQTDAVVREFLAAAAPVFTIDDRRASPIAETIARVILVGNRTGGNRAVFVLSDGRQFSKASPTLGRLDFECGPLPSGEEFGAQLRELLPSTEGIAIHFRFAKLEPVAKNRCAATVERYAALQETWTTALQTVGARVTWSMN